MVSLLTTLDIVISVFRIYNEYYVSKEIKMFVNILSFTVLICNKLLLCISELVTFPHFNTHPK